VFFTLDFTQRFYTTARVQNMVFLAAYTLASGTLETMPMLPTGLRRHPDFGTYYLHRRIPTDLLSCYPGKEMVSFSLRTKDYHVAVERHRLEEAKLTSNWGKQRQRLADQAARQHVVAIVRIDAMTSETIDAICKHVEAVRHINDGSQQLSPAAPGKGKQALKDELTQASKPIVFVQFAGSLNRDATIKPLLQALNASGFNAPGAQRINKNQTNEVRYFANTDFERAAAAKVASIAQDTFAKLGCPLPTLTAKLVQREDGKTSPTELWLMHSCEAKP